MSFHSSRARATVVGVMVSRDVAERNAWIRTGVVFVGSTLVLGAWLVSASGVATASAAAAVLGAAAGTPRLAGLLEHRHDRRPRRGAQ